MEVDFTSMRPSQQRIPWFAYSTRAALSSRLASAPSTTIPCQSYQVGSDASEVKLMVSFSAPRATMRPRIRSSRSNRFAPSWSLMFGLKRTVVPGSTVRVVPTGTVTSRVTM